MSELEQKLRTQLLRCDLGMNKGCYGHDNSEGECPYCDDPYVCPVDSFIRDCLGIKQTWDDDDSEFKLKSELR